MPSATQKRMHWAPNDVMLQFLEELEDQPDRSDMRFVLALLLAGAAGTAIAIKISAGIAVQTISAVMLCGNFAGSTPVDLRNLMRAVIIAA